MVNKKNTLLGRIPAEYYKKVNNTMDERFRNKLCSRKEATIPEFFRLQMRLPEFNLSLEKLKTLPKKEDLKW